MPAPRSPRPVLALQAPRDYTPGSGRIPTGMGTMNCTFCNTELPSGAVRCWKCGATQGARAPAAAPRWETCEVRLRQDTGFFSTGGKFLAEAQGPQGAHTLGTSPQFAPPYREDNTAAFAALQAITDQLVQDGWERVQPPGEEWYSYRFRRQLP